MRRKPVEGRSKGTTTDLIEAATAFAKFLEGCNDANNVEEQRLGEAEHPSLKSQSLEARQRSFCLVFIGDEALALRTARNLLSSLFSPLTWAAAFVQRTRSQQIFLRTRHRGSRPLYSSAKLANRPATRLRRITNDSFDAKIAKRSRETAHESRLPRYIIIPFG